MAFRPFILFVQNLRKKKSFPHILGFPKVWGTGGREGDAEDIMGGSEGSKEFFF